MSDTEGRFPWGAPQGQPWDERTGPDYIHPTQLPAAPVSGPVWSGVPTPEPTPAAPAAPAMKPRKRHSRALLAGAMALAVAAALGTGAFAGHVLWPPKLNLAAQPSTVAPVIPGPVGGSGAGGNTGGGAGSGSGGSGSVGGSVSAAVAKISPALVDINAAVGYSGAQAAGTGIVLSSDGYVLTNHHVVAGSTRLSVTDIGNGQTYQASVVGYDSTDDVAVIKLADASGLTTATLADSSAVRVGDTVVGVGNAGGVGGTPSAAAGSVIALDQSITANDEGSGQSEQLHGLIAVNANIQPGDSGGALVNTAGDVIGVDTAGSSSGQGTRSATTEGFAVPINTANTIAAQIIAGKSSSTVHIGATAFLGVELASGAGSTGGQLGVQGVVVGGVISGSAADQAGLAVGDVITAVDGQSVSTAQALHDALAGHRPGDTINLTWTGADGQSQSASVTLKAGPVG